MKVETTVSQAIIILCPLWQLKQNSDILFRTVELSADSKNARFMYLHQALL